MYVGFMRKVVVLALGLLMVAGILLFWPADGLDEGASASAIKMPPSAALERDTVDNTVTKNGLLQQNFAAVVNRLADERFALVIDGHEYTFAQLQGDAGRYTGNQIGGQGVLTLSVLEGVMFGTFVTEGLRWNLEISEQGLRAVTPRDSIDDGGVRPLAERHSQSVTKMGGVKCVNC